MRSNLPDLKRELFIWSVEFAVAITIIPELVLNPSIWVNNSLITEDVFFLNESIMESLLSNLSISSINTTQGECFLASLNTSRIDFTVVSSLSSSPIE